MNIKDKYLNPTPTKVSQVDNIPGLGTIFCRHLTLGELKAIDASTDAQEQLLLWLCRGLGDEAGNRVFTDAEAVADTFLSWTTETLVHVGQAIRSANLAGGAGLEDAKKN